MGGPDEEAVIPTPEPQEGFRSRAEQRVAQSRAVIVESKLRIKVAREHIDQSRRVMAQTRERMAAVRVTLP